MTVDCIDLMERFGRRYRVVYEESYAAEHGPAARTRDPWLMIVLCRYGDLYPFGGNRLAASVDGHPKIAGRLRRLKCCRVWQDGDFGELTVLFDVADFPAVAKIMRPRRRRQVTPEQRAELVRRLRGGPQTPTQTPTRSEHGARASVSRPRGDRRSPLAGTEPI